MTLPPTLTRRDHYAQLPLTNVGLLGRLWTHASALTAMGLFIREEGCWPKHVHLCAEECLPSQETIRRLFGSAKAWRVAYLAEEGAPPARAPYARRIACNRCERMWGSPDVRHFRTCQRCRKAETPDDWCNGDWMSGTPVIYDGTPDMEDVECQTEALEALDAHILAQDRGEVEMLPHGTMVRKTPTWRWG